MGGIILPQDIEDNISLGGRYLIHTVNNPKLLLSAWEDFTRRIRWKIVFEEQKSEPYDPELDLEDTSVEEPPLAPSHIEQGLKQGKAALLRQPIESCDVPSSVKRDLTMLHNVQDYLTKNKLLVTASDKNLGLVVMSLPWYHTKCEEYLDNNASSLAVIDKDEAVVENLITRNKTVALADSAPSYPLGMTKQEKLSLRSTEKKAEKFPTFAGLPKIHKKPFAFRPIIPCHSAVCNPAAKLLSKLLKPAIIANK